VTEGIYLWWIDDLLRSADAIVWLDLPWRIAAWRVVLRHITASLAGTNRHPGLGRLVRFLQSARRYYVDTTLRQPEAPDDDGAVTHAHTRLELRPSTNKVVRCATAREVDSVLSSIPPTQLARLKVSSRKDDWPRS
jgi:hypothetical protein